MMEENTLPIAILAIIAIFIITQYLKSSHRLPLPPGPSRAPILGNLHNFPKDNWVQTFTEWREQYGDIIYTSVLGKSTIILNSRKVMEDLMIERAPRYQNRPKQLMGVELSGWEWDAGFKQAGPELLQERKVLLSGLGPSTVKRWYSKIEKSIIEFVGKLAEDRDADILMLLRDHLAQIIIQVAYGEGIYQAHKEELIDTNTKSLGILNDIHSKFWFVDIFPFLQYLPKWFPGASFLRIAEESRSYTHKMRDWPFKLVLEESQNGTAHPSLARQSLEDGHDPERVRDGVAVLFAAGVDTSYTVLTTFVLAMLVYPEEQKKAQAEIDRFIQTEGRLPSFQDRDQLPYLEAITKELLRWNPPLPLSVAHANAEDDEYKGMRIPKDSTVMPNVRIAMHEEDTFPNPEKFEPDRYFKDHDNVLPDSAQFAFGFGRRICPGKHLADKVVYYIMSQMLALFTITPHPDVKLPVEAHFELGFFSYPTVPKCRFIPRNRAYLPIH